MNNLVAVLIPVIIVIVIAVIAIAITEKFSPDPLVTTIVRWVVFALVLIVVLTKLVPLIA